VPRSLRNQQSPEEQRNLIIATVALALIMFGWSYMFGPQPAPQQNQQAADTTAQTQTSTASSDTAAPAPSGVDNDGSGQEAPAQASSAQAESGDTRVPEDAITAAARTGTERMIVVDSEYFTAEFSTKGGTLKQFTLKDYKKFDQTTPVQLVDSSNTRGVTAITFTTPTNRNVDTRDLYFSASTDADTLFVTDAEQSLTFEAQLGEGTLRQTFTFKPKSYDIGLDVQQINATAFTNNDGYDLVWDGGLPLTEGGTQTELTNSGVFGMGTDEELRSVRLEGDSDHDEAGISGGVSWLAVKNKYFTAAMMPDNPDNARGADIIGDYISGETEDAVGSKQLQARLGMESLSERRDTDTFHFYLGPMYYYDLAKYDRGLYEMVDYGWDFFEWMTRPFALFVFIPMLTYLGGYLPYGIVVILMAVAIKVVVYPLTKKSYRSMAQMRELQPKMEEIKEKYGDDPQKQQEEMMNLYRETGVNPLGGCMPMLLQYPIIIALYQFIPQSIQLRQESFLWAADLSAPDKILMLPFEIPFLGDYLAGFTLLMGLSMVVTMRLQSTPGSGAQAQLLMYGMPVFIFFIFNQFASALSLYYLFYNIVTAAQQKWINYQLEQEEDLSGLETNGKNGKSKGFLGRLMDAAEEAREQQK
jgi:YidC/Oxa1 family membrane protein insertase